MYAHFNFETPFDRVSAQAQLLLAQRHCCLWYYSGSWRSILVLMRPNELTSTISTLSKIRFLQEQSWYFHQLMSIWWMRRRNCCWNTDFQLFKSEYGRKHFWLYYFSSRLKQENSQLVFTISANRFLRNMVRSIVGTLVNIGIHKITLDDFLIA
jgi:tRNA pseudouridine38-40 synthase